MLTHHGQGPGSNPGQGLLTLCEPGFRAAILVLHVPGTYVTIGERKTARNRISKTGVYGAAYGESIEAARSLGETSEEDGGDAGRHGTLRCRRAGR